jgi:hypothetical protein
MPSDLVYAENAAHLEERTCEDYLGIDSTLFELLCLNLS